jgi:molybdopterin/thiamine biosynthesis adenylyltransferase
VGGGQSTPFSSIEYDPPDRRHTGAPFRPARPLGGGGASSGNTPSARVAIAGVGDIGSRVAIALVQSSLARLSIADMDLVEYDNVGQSAFRAIDVGHSKVGAVERLCREINPDVEVRTCEADLQSLSELDLGMWLSDASLLVLGIDDPVALLRLHDYCYGRIPLVAAGIHDRGESGHVVYTVPGKTSCLRCALGIRKARDIVQIRGNAVSPDDVQRIAGEAASIALNLLNPGRSRPLEARRNVLFMNNREAGGFRSTEAHWLDVERQPNCRVCRGGSAI